MLQLAAGLMLQSTNKTMIGPKILYISKKVEQLHTD